MPPSGSERLSPGRGSTDRFNNLGQMGRGQAFEVLAGSWERCWTFAFCLGFLSFALPVLSFLGGGGGVFGEMKDGALGLQFPSLCDFL